MMDRGNVYVRRLSDREVVWTIPVSTLLSERDFETFMRGLIRKTDTDRFFVDDSEISFDSPDVAPERPAPP